jgi:hypothetical protein
MVKIYWKLMKKKKEEERTFLLLKQWILIAPFMQKKRSDIRRTPSAEHLLYFHFLALRNLKTFVQIPGVE